MFLVRPRLRVARQAKSLPEYAPVEITLFDFLFRWLAGMERDGVMAGTNWKRRPRRP
jgi:hypothetical protein